jgi:ClpP class serine protease
MKTSNYWFVDTNWLHQYVGGRLVAEEKDSRLQVDSETYSEMRERLMAARGSILDLSDDKATIRLHGPVTEAGPDLYDLYYGYEGLSYEELDSAVLEAHELLPKGATLYLDVDTPGGDASGTENSSNLISEVARERPVIAIVTGTMASAGVWITAGCTEIFAVNRSRVIGSVGVATSIVDWSELYANWGIHVYNLTNDKSKDKRPDSSTESGRQVTINLLNEFYELFIGALVTGRKGKGLTRASVEKLKGAVVLADRAFSTGFIDSIENSSLDTGNTPAQSVAAGLTEGTEMNLSQFLAENPEAAKELEKIKADSKAEGAAEERAAVAERHTAVAPFMAADYPAEVAEHCLAAVAGKESVEAVTGIVAYIDKRVAADAAAKGDKEVEAQEDTPAADVTKVEDEKTQRDADATVARVLSIL